MKVRGKKQQKLMKVKVVKYIQKMGLGLGYNQKTIKIGRKKEKRSRTHTNNEKDKCNPTKPLPFASVFHIDPTPTFKDSLVISQFLQPHIRHFTYCLPPGPIRLTTCHPTWHIYYPLSFTYCQVCTPNKCKTDTKPKTKIHYHFLQTFFFFFQLLNK